MRMDTMDAFNGLVGRASLKRQMGKILRTLKEGDLYRAMGGTPPKGLLFLGRPGTGKTSFAKAFMEASGRTSFLVRPGDPRFDDLDALFAEAKENAPSVILFDDLDKAYGSEGRGTRYGHLQSLIDAFSPEDVFVVATMNSTYRVPRSLIRKGRFDFFFRLEEVSHEDGAALVKAFAATVKCGKDVKISDLEGIVSSLTPAEAKEAVDEAARRALLSDAKEVAMRYFVEAISEKNLDEEDAPDGEEDRLEVSYHEAGHLLVAEALAPGSVGFAATWKEDGNVRLLRPEALSLFGRILVLLGGKIAVETFLPKTATGASNDLERAYDLLGKLYFERGAMGLGNLDFHIEEEMKVVPARLRLGSFLEAASSFVRRLFVENASYLEEAAALLNKNHYLLRSEIDALGHRLGINRAAVSSFALLEEPILSGNKL